MCSRKVLTARVSYPMPSSLIYDMKPSVTKLRSYSCVLLTFFNMMNLFFRIRMFMNHLISHCNCNILDMNRSGGRSNYHGTPLTGCVTSHNWRVIYNWVHISNIEEHFTSVNAKYLCGILVCSHSQDRRFIRFHKFTAINWRATVRVSAFPVKSSDQAKCSYVPQLERLVWGLTSSENLMSFWVYVNSISTDERTVDSPLKSFTCSQIPYV